MMKLTEFESNLKDNIVILHNKIDLINDRLLGPNPKNGENEKSGALYSHRDIMINSINELKECHEDLRPSFLAFCFDTPMSEQSDSAEMPPMVDMASVACSVLLGIRYDLRELCARLGVALKEEDTEKRDKPTTYIDECSNILSLLGECIETCSDILECIGTNEEVPPSENE